MIDVATLLKPSYLQALKFAKEHRSEETGFYHHSWEHPGSKETIPFFENLCFVMALLRSHQTEVMLEGRELLGKLLPFQNSEGGFPYYLHQYPSSYHPGYGLRSVVALYKISQIYGHILGNDLSKKVQQALKMGVEYIKGVKLTKALFYLREALLFVNEGGEAPFSYEIQSTEEIKDLLLANDLLKRETSIPWHRGVNRYAGPLHEEKQFEYESIESFINLLVDKKIDQRSPIHLYPVLLEDLRVDFTFPAEALHWKNVDRGGYFYSYLREPIVGETTFFRLSTKEHTLVLEERAVTVECEAKENGIDLIATYKEMAFDDDKGDLELSFYINHRPQIEFFVEGKRANVLYPKQKATLVIDSIPFVLTFEVKEGEGDVVLHFARGNRLSQVSPKVKKEWEAFDWQLAFRTLSRTEKFSLQISLREEN